MTQTYHIVAALGLGLVMGMIIMTGMFLEHLRQIKTMQQKIARQTEQMAKAITKLEGWEK